MKVTAALTTKGDKYYVIVGWYESEKRKQKWINTELTVSGNNKRKAEQKRLELQREWEDKVSAPNYETILFSDYLKRWLEETKHTIADSTYWEYKKTINKIISPYFEGKKVYLTDLKTWHIQEFYNYKMEHDGVTANTICHYHANISKALKYAMKTERLKNNPAANVELPKKQKHIADYYTDDELQTLLMRCKGSNLETIILLAACFGLRRGEIIGLRWDSIDFDNNTISIVGVVKDKGSSGSKKENLYYEETAKTDSSIRSFPMHPTVKDYLQKLKQTQDIQKQEATYNHTWDGFVCVKSNGDIIPLEYVTRRFPKLCESCGLKKIKLHELRHSNITFMLEQGANMKEIQEWAGHSSYLTTANTYSHIHSKSKERMSACLNKILCC